MNDSLPLQAFVAAMQQAMARLERDLLVGASRERRAQVETALHRFRMSTEDSWCRLHTQQEETEHA
jgi:hypothetical protein